MATAARTPTIIPAMAPPDSDELLLVVFSALAAIGVVVGEVVFVTAAVADVWIELLVVDVEVVDVEETDDVVDVVSVLFRTTSYEWIYDPATWLFQGHALQV
jgi:hypothetical protein